MMSGTDEGGQEPPAPRLITDSPGARARPPGTADPDLAELTEECLRYAAELREALLAEDHVTAYSCADWIADNAEIIRTVLTLRAAVQGFIPRDLRDLSAFFRQTRRQLARIRRWR
jgi:hypothetical protein